MPYTFNRKTIQLLSLFSLTLFLIPNFAICRDANGDAVVIGAGLESCGKYVRDRRNRQDTIFFTTWLAGFLSAANLRYAATYDLLRGADIHSALLWIENHCTKNPLDQLAAVADQFVNHLYPNRTIMCPENRCPKN